MVRASAESPGTRTPCSFTGWNSMMRPVQLISQPTTAVNTGMVQNATQPLSKKLEIPATRRHSPVGAHVTGPPPAPVVAGQRLANRASHQVPDHLEGSPRRLTDEAI